MTRGELSLSARLSKALVAFTIEFDNEFEHLTPHRTALDRAEGGGRPERGVWLASQAMWSNFLRFVPDEGCSVAQIEGLARTTRLPLAGMTRWGYVAVESDLMAGGAKQLAYERRVRPTRAGRAARDVWRPLGETVENRWRSRFGSEKVDALRKAMASILDQTGEILPDYLPLVSYGLWSKDLVTKRPLPRGSESRVELSTLLSRLLLLFATEFEADSPLSLAICANCLRVFGENETRVRDIPLLTGISKEACAVSVGYLERERYATVESGRDDARAKVVRLTAKGAEAQGIARARIQAVERGWSERFGHEPIRHLREALDQILTASADEKPLVAEGLAVRRDGWRFSKPYLARTAELLRDPAAALPQFPIVTHRGGYPDGS